MFSKPITSEEERFIKENAGILTTSEIATALGRNYYTIHRYVKLLGFDSGNHIWTPEEDELLKRLWEEFNAYHIGRRLGVNENCVYNRVRRLKLKKKRNKNKQ